MQISIPYQFKPRHYQLDLLKALDSGYKRAIAVYHRRAGKDKTLLNLVVKKAMERVGIYYYFFPEFAQGRRVIWDGIDGSGMRFRDHIPQQLIKRESAQEMQIVLINGSIIQIIGTDKFDKIRGSNPVGCVFSEYAFQNPEAWNVVRPILAENGGWAVFNSTPAGRNHFNHLYEMALQNKEWFSQLITVEDSHDEDGNRFITDEMIESERIAGMSEEMIRQEFYCDFNVNVQGYYYLDYLVDAENEGRIGNFNYSPNLPVETWWDIGVGDSTAIWFTQKSGNSINVINYYQNNSVGLEHYARHLQSLKYVYECHHFPHDMDNVEFGTGRTRIEMAEELFRGTKLDVVEKLGLEDGVNAARIILPHCSFDSEKCEKGLNALYNYHREFDDKLKEYKNKPHHDWSSHAADAFRYLAVGMSLPKKKRLSMKDSYLKKYKNVNTRGWMVA